MYACLGKDKKWNRFKVLKIQLRISFSFVGIWIGRIRLQFCEDIHFYQKLKIEVGLEGPMVFKNEQSNPSFDVSFLLTESRLLVRVNSFQMKNRIAVWSRCIYRESFSRLMKRNIYYPVCNIPCSYEWITKSENVCAMFAIWIPRVSYFIQEGENISILGVRTREH